MNRNRIEIVSLFFVIYSLLGISRIHGQTADYLHVAGLFDIRTELSDGVHTLNYVIDLAKRRGFGVLFFNEHDLLTVEYGVWPLRKIIKKRETRPSILRNGIANYLSQIQAASNKYPEMILIPGVESGPFYYWKGSIFKRNLALCDYEKHLLIVGFETEEDYEHLPIIHNKAISKFQNPTVSIGAFFLSLALYLVFFKKRHGKILKTLGVLLILFCLLIIVNDVAFKRSPYSPYKGYQGIAPYQQLIDYVNSRGGMAFWNHPETKSGQAKLGPVLRETAPYPYVLSESKNYAGFAALYAEGITITEPGGLWDQILLEYCEGTRENPIWGISSADYHEEGHAGEKLGNFPTVFLVKEKTKTNILEALKKGRMYAYRGPVDLPRLKLREFSISDSASTQRGLMGEEIAITGSPEISILISADEQEDMNPIKVRLIRNGELLKEFSGENPIKINFQDDNIKSGKKMFYRLDVRDSKDRIVVSNPIFVTLHSFLAEGY